MNLNTVTFEGNLTDAPQLGSTNTTSTPVTNATVLVNRRTKDEAGQWSDAEPTRHRITAWNRLAENLATLPKGTRVLIVGHTETTTWTDDQTGTRRTSDVVIVDAIGASLRYATVTITPATTNSAEPSDDTNTNEANNDEAGR